MQTPMLVQVVLYPARRLGTDHVRAGLDVLLPESLLRRTCCGTPICAQRAIQPLTIPELRHGVRQCRGTRSYL